MSFFQMPTPVAARRLFLGRSGGLVLSGAAVALPVDFTGNATTVAKINSLKVVLEVQSQYKDSTGAFPVTRVVSTIALSNCSEALGSQTLSC